MKSLESDYIKHPVYCEKCDAVTPHTELQMELDDKDTAKVSKGFSFAAILEYFGSLLGSLAQIDGAEHILTSATKYRCQQCGHITEKLD